MHHTHFDQYVRNPRVVLSDSDYLHQGALKLTLGPTFLLLCSRWYREYGCFSLVVVAVCRPFLGQFQGLISASRDRTNALLMSCADMKCWLHANHSGAPEVQSSSYRSVSSAILFCTCTCGYAFRLRFRCKLTGQRRGSAGRVPKPGYLLNEFDGGRVPGALNQTDLCIEKIFYIPALHKWAAGIEL